MAQANVSNLIAGVFTVGFSLSVYAVGIVVAHKPARANAHAQKATGYECTACHVNISENVTRAGLTPFGTQWQDNKCPSKDGNLCAPVQPPPPAPAPATK